MHQSKWDTLKKNNSRWGVIELLEWVEKLRNEGIGVELHIVADKISNGPDPEYMDLQTTIVQRMSQLNAHHYKDLNRSAAMDMMARMDFVWCWRPSIIEDNTLELSTKLVEMVAAGARCICYPNQLNSDALGNRYPFFIKDVDQFRKLLLTHRWSRPSRRVIEGLRKKHSLTYVTSSLSGELLPQRAPSNSTRISIASHDFKFVDPYVSHLKATGHEVVRDDWEWGAAINLRRSRDCHDWAQIIFCEWGLANAVWHSNNRGPGKRVFIRAHLQEINQRARKFGYSINIDNVEKVIFVSQRVRDCAVKMFGWAESKTVVVPNFVLTDEYRLVRRDLDETIRLGVVGIVPQRKRFDRAVDTLMELRRRDYQAELFIKGPRPETLDYMDAPGRKTELDYYQEIYRRIELDLTISQRVHFDPWANDVALWYRKVDHILSCSDFESFHYALADGVLTGCHPVVWPWEEAATIYTADWIVGDSREAADRIVAFRALSKSKRSVRQAVNRELVAKRYGHNKIFCELDEILDLR